MMPVSWVNVDIYHGTKASFTQKHGSTPEIVFISAE